MFVFYRWICILVILMTLEFANALVDSILRISVFCKLLVLKPIKNFRKILLPRWFHQALGPFSTAQVTSQMQDQVTVLELEFICYVWKYSSIKWGTWIFLTTNFISKKRHSSGQDMYKLDYIDVNCQCKVNTIWRKHPLYERLTKQLIFPIYCHNYQQLLLQTF